MKMPLVLLSSFPSAVHLLVKSVAAVSHAGAHQSVLLTPTTSHAQVSRSWTDCELRRTSFSCCPQESEPGGLA